MSVLDDAMRMQKSEYGTKMIIVRRCDANAKTVYSIFIGIKKLLQKNKSGV